MRRTRRTWTTATNGPAADFLSTAEDLVRFGSTMEQPGFLKAEITEDHVHSAENKNGRAYRIRYRLVHPQDRIPENWSTNIPAVRWAARRN